MDALASSVKQKAKSLFPAIVSLRRDLHAHPELSFQEKRTSEKIKTFLDEHQIPYTDHWAGHGIVAKIAGYHNGPVVMLRADMDALPIREENDVEYRSRHDGVMHACGHDVHSSSLCGVGAILNDHREFLKGEVQLIFQPGEEKLPGGASVMLKEGLLDNNQPKWILAQHVFPSLPAGHVGFRQGLYMASADEIYITIIGKGGHAGMPHQSIDPVVISSRVILALQEITSRQSNPLSPNVLTIGKINSEGGATNVIPGKVFLEGTLRAMDETWRQQAHDHIQRIVEHTCFASGATCEVKIEKGYPCLINDELITEMCKRSAIEFLGNDNVHLLPQRMTSEDFAFFTHAIPGCFYRLGTASEDGRNSHSVHTSRFDIDESALETGMGLMAYITLRNQ